MLFGAVLRGPALPHLDWRIVTYAVLSLTVVRMLPVALALAGSRLSLPTVGCIGWFGPRGRAAAARPDLREGAPAEDADGTP